LRRLEAVDGFASVTLRLRVNAISTYRAELLAQKLHALGELKALVVGFTDALWLQQLAEL